MQKWLFLVLFVPLFFSGLVPVHAEANDATHENIYSIMLDRFNNGDPSLDKHVDHDNLAKYQGGDIKGVIDKLDYIKDLGFTAISLSPVMENAKDGYHGYWVTDYFKMNPVFGSMADLQKLVKAAHERDMKVLLDFAPSYAHRSHPMAKDDNATKEQTDYGLPWQDETIKWNLDNPDIQKMLFKAGDFWLDESGADGYDLLAVDQTPVSFLRDFSEHIKDEKPNAQLIGNVLTPDKLSKEYRDLDISFTENRTMQKNMADVFSHAGSSVANLYHEWEQNGRKDDLKTIDGPFQKRFTQKILKNKQNPTTSWNTALVYMYTTPGEPQIYQGSEIPMDGKTVEEGQRLVTFNNSDQDLADDFSQMALLREKHPVLKDGDFTLEKSNGGMSVFKRSNADETMYIAINNDKVTKAVSIDDIAKDKQLTGLLEDNIVREHDGNYKIGLDRESAEVYVLEDDQGLNWLFIGMVLGIFLLFVIAIVALSMKQRRRHKQQTT